MRPRLRTNQKPGIAIRFTVRWPDNGLTLESVVSHKREGRDHRVISCDRAATLRQLGGLGAENVAEHRLSIDEIAVEILKG